MPEDKKTNELSDEILDNVVGGTGEILTEETTEELMETEEQTVTTRKFG